MSVDGAGQCHPVRGTLAWRNQCRLGARALAGHGPPPPSVPDSRADHPPALWLHGAAGHPHPQWADGAGRPPAAGTQRLLEEKPEASGPRPCGPFWGWSGDWFAPPAHPTPLGAYEAGPVGRECPGTVVSFHPALPERRVSWRARTVPRRGGLLSPDGHPPCPPGAGRLGLGARLPAPTHSPRPPPAQGLQKPHRQRDQGIQQVSFEPTGCQHPSPRLHPQQLQAGQPLGRAAPHCRQGPGCGLQVPAARLGGPEAPLTSRPPSAGSSGPRRSGRWCPSGRTCPPGRLGAVTRPRALRTDEGLSAPPPHPGCSRSGQRTKAPGGSRRTLAEEGVLGQVPQGRLHHLEVAAAQAVHERGQEVGCDAEKATCPGQPRPSTPNPSQDG